MGKTDITKATDAGATVLGNFQIGKGKDAMLGEGSFSVVRKGIDLRTQKPVAIKSYKLENIRKDSKDMNSVMLKYKRQIEVLKALGERE